jgi:lipopolysaccharide/colanic/teichoic acid biosynthesis glycosyltransferase
MCAILFFFPLLLIVSALILLTDPGPIFFAHKRIGRDGRMFYCLKFRTMARNADELLAEILARDPVAAREWKLLHKLKTDPRVTAVGRFLRASSIDELPQLLNVFRGEMSLVGPRPIVPSEAHKYGVYLRDYCSVKPGLTGLWQVSGRNETTYRRRIALDVAYTRRRNFGLDCWIMLKTIPAIFSSNGC